MSPVREDRVDTKAMLFPLKARQPLRVARELVRQDLDGDLPAQARVGGAIHLVHAA